MNKYDEIAQRYADGGIRDDQLDGTGAPEGSVYLARNYVALGAITQAQADAIRAGAADRRSRNCRRGSTSSQKGVKPHDPVEGRSMGVPGKG